MNTFTTTTSRTATRTANRTALRLLVATPLAAGAIAFGGFAGTAHADGPVLPGPGVIVAQPGDDPTPNGPGEIALPEPKPEPKPEGPKDIAQPEDDEDPKPQGPGDITNPEDDDDPKPEGPGDITNPEDEDQPEDVPGDEVPADAPEGGEGSDGGKDAVASEPEVDADVQVPNRIDAGAGSADEDGFQLAWLLAGGGLVTAAGSVLARKRFARSSR